MLPPPMPFKIFVLSAGVFGLPFRRFALTLLVARGLRYALLGRAWAPSTATRRWPCCSGLDGWFRDHAVAVLAGLAAVVAVVALGGVGPLHARRGPAERAASAIILAGERATRA